jgi:hypothetical protein
VNYVENILISNTKDLSERRIIHALTESDKFAVNNVMINNLYQSALNKAHVDFEDIPNSAGDITRYSGFNTMVSVLNLIRDIATKSNDKIEELDTVRTAIDNIITYRDLYEKGFKLQKQFIILHYNTLVYACVEATSSLVSSFIDYIKRPDKVEFVQIKNTKIGNTVCTDNLTLFNNEVKSGNYAKILTAILQTNEEGFTGGAAVISALIIGGLLVIVPIIRELIFYFYYSRVKLSDYLLQQATLLEMQKANIESNAVMTNTTKKEIMAKQTERINTLRNLSNKISVDYAMSKNKASDDIHKEDKGWSIDKMPKEVNENGESRFKIL